MKTKHKLNPMKNIFLLLLLFTGMVEAQIVNIPDANLKSALLLANATNHYASMFDGSYVSIDINLDGEIQYSEAALITGTIDLSELPNNGLSVSNLTGIEAFTNMRSFVCLPQYQSARRFNASPKAPDIMNRACGTSQDRRRREANCRQYSLLYWQDSRQS